MNRRYSRVYYLEDGGRRIVAPQATYVSVKGEITPRSRRRRDARRSNSETLHRTVRGPFPCPSLQYPSFLG